MSSLDNVLLERRGFCFLSPVRMSKLEGGWPTTRNFVWCQAQLEGDRAATAIWKLVRFLVAGPVGGRQGYNCNLGTRGFLVAGPVVKSTGLQLQSGNSRFLVAGPVGRRQGYNCNLGTRDFWQAQLEGDRATTAIWELEVFCQQAQLEGDRATTAIWELEIFLSAGPVGSRQGCNCNLGTRDFWWQAQL